MGENHSLCLRTDGPEDSSDDTGSTDALPPRKALYRVEAQMSVPQTDTGRRGEKPQVREINHVKELGKIAP